MKIDTLLAFSILLIACTFSQNTTKKLIYVQSVFRHGSRYPLYPNPKDFSNISGIEVLNGQLTIQGKNQHYMLGQKLYETYWEPLFGKNNQYRQQKFYFKSTDVNRTIQSINSQLLGVFEKTNPLKINESEIPFSLPAWNNIQTRDPGDLYSKTPFFHPFPIHLQKGPSTPWTPGDFLRAYQKQFCYKQNEWEAANKRDPYILEITQNSNFTKAVKALSQALNEDVSFYDVQKYYDSALCLILLGKKALPVFTQDNDISRDLAKIYLLQANIRLFHTEQQLKTTATPYFNQTVNDFKRVTQSQQGVQWVFYSAHDLNIQNYLAKMGLANLKCIYENYLNGTKSSDYCILATPTYSSTLIFEVYQYQNKRSTFQIRYNGDYRRIPFCQYKLECDVQIFYKWYDSWKDENWVQNCGITNTTAQSYFSIIIVELGIIIVFAVAAILRYLNKKEAMNNRDQKSKVVSGQNDKKMDQSSLISEQNQNP